MTRSSGCGHARGGPWTQTARDPTAAIPAAGPGGEKPEEKREEEERAQTRPVPEPERLQGFRARSVLPSKQGLDFCTSGSFITKAWYQ